MFSQISSDAHIDIQRGQYPPAPLVCWPQHLCQFPPSMEWAPFLHYPQ